MDIEQLAKEHSNLKLMNNLEIVRLTQYSQNSYTYQF